MADAVKINNWFGGELVATTDMKPVNALMLSNLFSNNNPGTVFGIVPTLNTGDMTFDTTAGYAFFGITADSTYISNTGASTLGCTVEAQAAIELVDLDCYIYIKSDITTSMSNRYTNVAGIVYSSTNAADVGIKICDVVDGVAINFNNNDIRNYTNIEDGILSFQSPDGSNINLQVDGELNVETNVNGVTSTLSSNGNTDPNLPAEWNIIAKEGATNNASRFLVSIHTNTHQAEAAMTGLTNGVEKYRLSVYNNHRPQILFTSALPPAESSDILIQNDLAFTATDFLVKQKFPGGIGFEANTASITTVDGIATLNFETPFLTKCTLCIPILLTNNTNYGISGVSDLTTSSVKIALTSFTPDDTYTINYIALGY